MRFASLGSGSRGNALLVEAGATCIMVDCGFSVRETERRLARLGKCPQDIAAIVVTHEHSDHLGGVGALAGRYQLPVYMTHGTACAQALGGGVRTHTFSSHSSFALGDLEIQPFPVPHDAREPAQFVFGDGARRLGLLTDTGSLTAHIVASLMAVDALVVECNHDVDLLANGVYPPPLRQRVGGDLGHLNNDQAARLVQALESARWQHLVAAHLSAKHNTPALARAALAQALGCDAQWIGIADQDAGLDWRSIQ